MHTRLIFILAALPVLFVSTGVSAKSFCIDPGHGGSDSGAVGCGLIESHLTLNVSKQIRDMLKAAGHTVYMTRETDKDVGLSERANYANSKGVDTFASIHINSFNASSTGIETYCYTGCLARKDSSYEQASKIQSQMLAVWSLTNRGVKDANYAVVRETNMPATLSELAFISNCGADYTYLSSEAHLKEAAQAHCKALTAQWAGGEASACSGGGSPGGDTPPSSSTGKVMAGTFKNSLDDTSDANWLGGVKYTIGSQSQTSAASKTMMTFEVPVGSFTATASKDGYNTATRTDCSPAAADAISWCSIALTPVAAEPAKGKLSGSVTDGSTNAKIAATIHLNGANIAYDGNTDWVSGALEPKTYTVEATADGYDKGSASCTVESNKTNPCPITLNPQKSTISGIVFDNETQAQIAASLTLGEMHSSSTETTKWEFVVDAGTYTITASSPGYETGNKSCTVEKGMTATCDIGLNKAGNDARGSITGKLTDSSTGSPLAGTVSVAGESDFACDASGIYHFALNPGVYQVTGAFDGYQPNTVECKAVAGETTTCDIALTAAAGESRVVGTVYDASTQAKIAATVHVDGQSIDYNGQDQWSIALSPGSYEFTASAAGYRDGAKNCVAIAGKDSECHIALVSEDAQVGALEGVVYNEDGGFNDNDEPLLPLSAKVTVKGFDPVSCDSNGKWSVEGLPPVAYLVTADKDGYYSNTVTCKVIAGESSYCPIALTMKKSSTGNEPEEIDVPAASANLVDEDCSSLPLHQSSSIPLALLSSVIGLLSLIGIRRRNQKEMK